MEKGDPPAEAKESYGQWVSGYGVWVYGFLVQGLGTMGSGYEVWV